MKTKSVKWLIFLVGVVLVILIISLFSDTISSFFNSSDDNDEDEDVVELDIVYAYQNSQWNQAIEDIIASFEEENPDISINYQISYEDEVYEDILNKLIARDELGDIVQLKTPAFYVEGDLLTTIPDEVSELVDTTYEKNGEVYAVGAIGTTVGIVYNKTLFDEYGLSEPSTYEEFLEICEVLEENGDTPIIVGGADLWHMEYWVNHFLRTDILNDDADWLEECLDGEVSWTDDEAETMFEHIVELFNSGYVDSDWNSTTDSSLPYLMSQGDVGMVYTSSSFISMVEEIDSSIELGWFYLPDEDGDVVVGENRDVYWALTKECGEDTEKYEAATKFLEYFYTSDEYTDLCENLNALYSTEEEVTYDNSSELQQEVIDDFNENEDHITSYIGNEDTPQGFEKKFLSIIVDTINGENDIESALDLCDYYWNQYLEEEQ